MNISSSSPVMRPPVGTSAQPQIQMAMMKKSNDATKEQGESALKLIEASVVPVQNQGTSLGSNIDKYA